MRIAIRPIAILATGALLALGACDRSDTSYGRAAPASGANAVGEPAGRTAMDQSESPEHIKITSEIRRAIMNDGTMSVSAQNVTIITDSTGTVTLRGNVASEAERSAVEAKARALAGSDRVVSQLVVDRD